MATTLLVLGGGGFVGRAVVLEGLARGWEVTTFNGGRGWKHSDVRQVIGDRLDANGLASSLADGTWDLVVDTWAGPPRAVRLSAAALAGSASRYAYGSSCSV